jgi:hypothetical protein
MLPERESFKVSASFCGSVPGRVEGRERPTGLPQSCWVSLETVSTISV